MQEVFENVADQVLAGVHSIGESLDYADIGKAVNDQAREEVAFPMNEAVGVRAVADSLAQPEGLCDPVPEKKSVDNFETGGKEADRNQGVGLIEPDPERPPGGVQN